ncbi:hypothetical protein, partial [Acinetobacter sp. YH12102]|uniref:hypothetical protein n=1 Tax=Acinetobacter sp. YH12102 TaxID=2601091 RepID=UPI00211E7E31
IPTNSPKNDFTLKVPTVEGIHLLYLEINKIFSLSCQPICNSAIQAALLLQASTDFICTMRKTRVSKVIRDYHFTLTEIKQAQL